MNEKFCLSPSETNVLKGIAILMLLWHHLFYTNSSLYDGFIFSYGHNLVQELARQLKMCVGIFVFLSGYGLMRQASQNGGVGNLGHWYQHRFSKIMANYWLIWILFVPIGVFVFGRPLIEYYGASWQWKLLVDILGMANVFGFYGYNPTWWFISCIMILYILFPFLFWIVNKKWWVVAGLSLIVAMLPIRTGACNMHTYLFPFVCGLIAAKYPIKQIRGGRICYLVAIPILMVVRAFWGREYLIDGILSYCMVSVLLLYNLNSALSNILAYLGRHSMNIFLFHTFIFSHWLKSFVYSPRNPVLIYFLFLAICISISIAVEKIKIKLNFSRIYKNGN